MSKQELTVKSYPALVKQIQEELFSLDFFIKRRTAEAYWKVGKFIHDHLLEYKERADYGYTLFEHLAKDIDRDKSTLQRAVQFYRAYPILAERRQLNWNHYKCLITVQDKDKREAFEKMALKREWTAEKLEEAIRLDKLKIEEPKEQPAQPAYKLTVTRSRLFTYKVLEPNYIHPIEERLVIDLGFNILIQAEIKGIKLKQGEIIESTKTGESYSFKHSDASPKELYTYKALVERVVDADTIWLNIDLGFDCWLREKVRLRGIDAPELSTNKGKEAKELVEARLKEVNFVVVKTHSSDKYERYLADVFYPPLNLRRANLPKEENLETVLEQGIFLNQELLDLGLAVKM